MAEVVAVLAMHDEHTESSKRYTSRRPACCPPKVASWALKSDICGKPAKVSLSSQKAKYGMQNRTIRLKMQLELYMPELATY